MNRNALPHRRDFIKTVSIATAYSSLLGRAWTDLVAAEIQPAATTTGTLRIKLSDFPALLSESGSVRLLINPLRGGPPTGPTPTGSFYPVLINRGPNDTFFALNSRCTHQGCVVDPLDSSTNRMTCPCHGSVFGIDGRRISGQASTRLTAYIAKFDGQDALQIQIPNLAYSVIASTVAGGGATAGSRLRLDFRTQRNVDYEVHFHESLAQEPTPILFSRTADGPLDQTVFTATTVTTVSLFVERTAASGFYHVAVRVSEG
ncbi:MAG: Rieske (2Fe-2S) protein [Verrucomicrobia bacterium]|nr:Rieske (2Fe-2S) protein [Verrucomicrobiota bacterium]